MKDNGSQDRNVFKVTELSGRVQIRPVRLSTLCPLLCTNHMALLSEARKKIKNDPQLSAGWTGWQVLAPIF